jgi:hypothetical protein
MQKKRSAESMMFKYLHRYKEMLLQDETVGVQDTFMEFKMWQRTVAVAHKKAAALLEHT